MVRTRRKALAALLLALSLGLAGLARAHEEPAQQLERSDSVMDDYDPRRAGHPVRILAYLIHPVGVALDYLVMRPAYWIGSYEPMRTIFGRTD